VLLLLLLWGVVGGSLWRVACSRGPIASWLLVLLRGWAVALVGLLLRVLLLLLLLVGLSIGLCVGLGLSLRVADALDATAAAGAIIERCLSVPSRGISVTYCRIGLLCSFVLLCMLTGPLADHTISH
jgi:hypothetical protein